METKGEAGSTMVSENMIPLDISSSVSSSSGQFPVLNCCTMSSPIIFFWPVLARNVICWSFLPTWVTTPSSIISRNAL